jgi:hypothetical protein
LRSVFNRSSPLPAPKSTRKVCGNSLTTNKHQGTRIRNTRGQERPFRSVVENASGPRLTRIPASIRVHSFYYPAKFCQAAPTFRSAAVPGRSHMARSRVIGGSQRVAPSDVPAPGDGRTPFGGGCAALGPFVVKKLYPWSRATPDGPALRYSPTPHRMLTTQRPRTEVGSRNCCASARLYDR